MPYMLKHSNHGDDQRVSSFYYVVKFVHTNNADGICQHFSRSEFNEFLAWIITMGRYSFYFTRFNEVPPSATNV